MALELLGGAAVGAAVGELLKAVLEAKEKATTFRQVLTRLELTLRTVIPRVNEINRLNNKLKLPGEEMRELITILHNGQTLVNKCSNISTINLVRKGQYSKKIIDLDYSLLRYFQTILPLDHFRDGKEMLLMVRELHMGLVGSKDEGESSKPMEDEGVSDIQSFQDPEKKVTENAVPTMEESSINQLEKLYQKEAGKQLFLLKGCKYSFDLEDLLTSRATSEGKGTYGTTYRCYTLYGDILLKRFKEIKVGKGEFEQHIEYLGKVGKHPNIVPPLGYYFSNSNMLLFYDYVPTGSLYSRLHENVSGGRATLDWDTRLKISLGAARGLSHLHSEGGAKFIHGNIKSSNVLLTPNFDGCISDCGLAPIIKRNSLHTASKKPGYYAPEYIKTTKATHSSDVYSFGVILLEILTGKIADQFDLPSWVHTLVREERTLEVFNVELSLEQNGEGMVRLLQIAMQCVIKKANERPKMNDIVKMIENIRPSH